MFRVGAPVTRQPHCRSGGSEPESDIYRAPGQRQRQGAGTAGLTYTLQTSTNLVDWLNRTSLLADPGGLIECLLDMETNAPACFYRLRWP